MTKTALKIFIYCTNMYFHEKESQNYLPGKLRMKRVSFKAEVQLHTRLKATTILSITNSFSI